MKLFDKLKWVVIIGVVFTLVLATNLIDKRNFKSISESIVTIYEDRLVVKNIILDMATTINKKEVAFLTRDTTFLMAKNEALSVTLNSDLQKLGQTKVTNEEEKSLDMLRKNIELMLQAENELLGNQFENFDNYNEIIVDVNNDLDDLAHIQMEEGKKHFLISQRKMGTIELFTQIETYFLIFLAVIALIIVLYKPQE